MDAEIVSSGSSYRWAGAAGVASIVCAAAAEAFERGAVRASQPPVLIAAYFTDNQQALRLQALMFLLSSGFALWFYPAFARRLGEAERGTARLATTALGAAMVSIGLTFVALTVQIGLATAARYAGEPALLAMLNALFMVACVPNAVMLTAVGVICLRSRALPTWMAWLSAAAALTQIVPVLGVVTDTGPLASGGWASAWLPYPLYAAWVLCAAVLLIRTPTSGSTSGEQPARAAVTPSRPPATAAPR